MSICPKSGAPAAQNTLARARTLWSFGLLTVLVLWGPHDSALGSTSVSPNTILVAESRPLTLFYALESVLQLPMRSPHIAERLCNIENLPEGATKESAAQVQVRCATARALGRKAFATVRRSVAFWPGETLHATGYQGGWNIEEVLEVAAVQSADLQDFYARIAPLMPAPALIDLMAALEQLEPLVRKGLLEKRSAFQRRAKQVLLDAMSARNMLDFLAQTGQLLGSQWPTDLPITVALVPVPVSRGSGIPTYAHRSGPVVIVEVLEDDELEHRLGVIAHELVHVLWFSRPLERVEKLAAAFRASSPTFGRIALTLLSEGIATALGNGIFVAQNTKKTPKGQWYADPDIDRFAHLLYPLLQSRLATFSPIDDSFAKDLVELLAARAPDAIYSPRLNFRHAIVIADPRLYNDKGELAQQIRTHLGSERVRVLGTTRGNLPREIIARLGDYGTILAAPPDNAEILAPFVHQDDLNELVGDPKKVRDPEVVTCRTSQGKWYAIILTKSAQGLSSGLKKLANTKKIPACGKIP